MENFKKWFKLMWNNYYIQLYLLAIILLIFVIKDYNNITGFGYVITIPILMMGLIIYKGFYLHWKKNKNKL